MGAIGGQRVGVGRLVPRLDDDGEPVINQLHEPVNDELVVWVDGCMFEPKIPAESDLFELQSVGDRGRLARAAATPAQCFLPVHNGMVPARDDNGQSVDVPVADITSRAWLLYDGGRYELRGDAVLEPDDMGREDHVWCRCERTRG